MRGLCCAARCAHTFENWTWHLNSTNGTFINGEKLEPQRYIELKERDSVKFGFSSRDYVLLHDESDSAGGKEHLDID